MGYSNSMIELLKSRAEEIDGRARRGRRYLMFEILLIVLCAKMVLVQSVRRACYLFDPDLHKATVPGSNVQAESQLTKAEDDFWKENREGIFQIDMEDAEKNLKLLRRYSPFKNGIPDHSCISRALAAADADILESVLREFSFDRLPPVREDELIPMPIDGKAFCAALVKAKTGQSLYAINAYDAQRHLILGSFKVGDKTNEASELKAELKNLLMGGHYLVTMDGMGTQKALISMIHSLGSHYLLPVKKNQKNLRKYLQQKLTVACTCGGEKVEAYLDLNGLEDEEACCIIQLEDEDVSIQEEDYTVPEEYVKLDAEEDDDIEPAEDRDGAEETEIPTGTEAVYSFPFFDKLHDYSYDKSLPVLSDMDSIKELNPRIVYVRFHGRTIKMVKNGDRYERREVEVFHSREWIDGNKACTGFESIECVGMVTRYRLVQKYSSKKKQYYALTVTRTPYIADIDMPARSFGTTIRNHWSIEQMHNDLDVVWKEDSCTAKTGSAPVVLSLLRKLARNLLAVVATNWSQAVGGSFSDSFREVRKRLELGQKVDKALEYLDMNFREMSTGIFLNAGGKP